MTQYYLGVDVGGTKSHALIADSSGEALGVGIGGPGNFESVNFEGLQYILKDIVDQALQAAGISIDQLSGAGLGIAGYDWPSERPPVLEQIRTLDLACPYEVVNDAIIGLFAGAREGWGVVILAGTSNNCRGWDRDQNEGRVTGNGIFMGEYGGAYEVVVKAIQAVSMAWSMRGPRTRLTQTFINLTGASNEADLLEGLSMNRYHIGASSAPLVFKDGLEHNDPVSLEIIQWAGQELGGLANGVIRQLGIECESFDVIQAGSLHDGGPLLANAIEKTIHTIAPGARLVRLTAPPVAGGVLLGMEKANFDARKVYDRLIESAAQVFAQKP